jgi:RNAse (barnase) inhibitor barstar
MSATSQTNIADLLRRTELAGPYRLRREQLPVVLDAARELNFQIAEVALGETLLVDLGRQLAFPEHYGANFDALYDCLTDSQVMAASGCLLVFAGTVDVPGDDDEESPVDTLIAVLQGASDEWREQGRALWALFAVPGLPLDPLPA